MDMQLVHGSNTDHGAELVVMNTGVFGGVFTTSDDGSAYAGVLRQRSDSALSKCPTSTEPAGSSSKGRCANRHCANSISLRVFDSSDNLRLDMVT